TVLLGENGSRETKPACSIKGSARSRRSASCANRSCAALSGWRALASGRSAARTPWGSNPGSTDVTRAKRRTRSRAATRDSSERDQRRLGKEEPPQRAASRSQRQPHRRLVRPRDRPCEEEVRSRRPRHAEDERDYAEQTEQKWPRGPEQVLAQLHDCDGDSFL